MSKAVLLVFCLFLAVPVNAEPTGKTHEREKDQEKIKVLARLGAMDSTIREQAIERLIRADRLADSDILVLLEIATNGLLPSPKGDDYALLGPGICEPWATLELNKKAIAIGWKTGMHGLYSSFNDYFYPYPSYHFPIRDASDRKEAFKKAAAARKNDICDSSVIRVSRELSKESALKVLSESKFIVEQIVKLHQRNMHASDREREVAVLKKILESGKLSSHDKGKVEEAIEHSQEILNAEKVKNADLDA